MRKVYHTGEGNPAGLALAVIFSVGITSLLFGFLPFAHRVATPRSSLEIRKVSSADLPPPVTEEAPPPSTEAAPPPVSAPEPQLAEIRQQIPLSADLDVAVGTGGALAGFGASQSLTAAESVAEEAFNVADLEKRPEVLAQIAPVYPAELRKARVEGTVTLLFLLDENGRVEDPRVDHASRPEFEKPALEALRKWRFKPGEKEGQPVKTYMRLPIRFRLAG